MAGLTWGGGGGAVCNQLSSCLLTHVGLNDIDVLPAPRAADYRPARLQRMLMVSISGSGGSLKAVLK